MNQIQQFFEYIFNSFKIFIIVQPWEAGIRVRGGNKIKKLKKGMYFRIPYYDSVFIQESRLRVTEMPIQTLTTLDHKTITISSSFGYSINDVDKLYKTLYHPESTLKNIAASELATLIYSKRTENITPKELEVSVLNSLKKHNYGISFDYFKITNFAIVRTYRLIQDGSWTDEGLDMNSKK